MGERGPTAASASALGFLCDELSTDPWTAIALDAVREKAWERGLTVSVMATRGDADMEAAALAQLAAQPLVGLIYATINTRLIDPPACALPLVLLNCHVADGSLPVRRSRRGRGRPRGDRLSYRRRSSPHRLHQRRGEHGGGAPSAARLQSGARHCRSCPSTPTLVRDGNWQPLSGYEATRALMRLSSPPSAIFCANDLMALGCYEALRELGLRIPDEVAVMGYDDREIAQHLHPPLVDRAAAAL